MNSAGIRVMVVDDDEDDYIIVADALKRIPGGQFESQWASTTDAGYEAMLAGRADIYLVDYLIGVDNGVDLLKRAITQGVRAPIIILTGQGAPEVDAAAMRAGAADYLVKRDLDPERLGRSMRYALDRARYVRAIEDSESRYRQIFQRNPMPMWVIENATHKFLAVNEAACDHYGYTQQEFLSMTAIDIRPEDERANYVKFHENQPRGLVNAGLWRHQARDGHLIDVEIIAHDLDFGGKAARLVLAIDVTEKLRASAAVRDREAQLRQILSDALDALFVVDADGLIGFANSAAGYLTGKDPESLVQTPFPWPDLLEVRRGEIDFIGADNTRHAAESRTSRTHWEGTDAALVALRDVTDQRRADERLRLLQRAIDSSSVGVLIADARKPDNPAIFINPAFERITGYSTADVLGRNCRFLQGPERQQAELDVVRESLRNETGCEVVLRNYRKDGTLFWNNLTIAPVRNSAGEVTHYVSVINDITERRRIEGELAYLATHDSVTGLPRYLAIEDSTRAAIEEAQRKDGRVLMIYVDLDRFHAVNESLGYSVGDQALRVVADRLRVLIGASGKVARIGGDEFVLVYNDVEREFDPSFLAEHIRTSIEHPIDVQPYTVYLTCSVGVSAYPDTAASAVELLQQSEAALVRAKRSGRNAVHHFNLDQSQELADRLSLGGRLRDATRKNELVLHYQPQVSSQNGQVVGLEALVRWQSPEFGFLPPGRFIRVAEELGLIIELGQWVLERACRQAKTWLDQGLGEFTMAVNVSALQLHRPSFVEEVAAVLAQTGLPAHVLELELTESSIMENVDRMVETMHALKRLGIRLALDDFGIGYSSLNYLKRFPIDKLKIDQSFVRDIASDSGDAGIARAIIAMGHQLGMAVMAEGVETAAQAGYLRRNHCDQFQGLFFSAAVPSDQTQALLRRRYLAEDSFVSQGSARTLLLLDDEENILRALTRLLRRDGYQILTASSAAEAFDLLGRHVVQVVVSDQRMPDISGTDFLSQVRTLYPDTVRLVLSGYTDLRAVTDAINRGSIYKFLTKPWDDEDLRREIREAFRTHAERTQHAEMQ